MTIEELYYVPKEVWDSVLELVNNSNKTITNNQLKDFLENKLNELEIQVTEKGFDNMLYAIGHLIK